MFKPQIAAAALIAASTARREIHAGAAWAMHQVTGSQCLAFTRRMSVNIGGLK